MSELQVQECRYGCYQYGGCSNSYKLQVTANLNTVNTGKPNSNLGYGKQIQGQATVKYGSVKFRFRAQKSDELSSVRFSSVRRQVTSSG